MPHRFLLSVSKPMAEWLEARRARIFLIIPDIAVGLYTLLGTLVLYVVIRLGIRHDDS